MRLALCRSKASRPLKAIVSGASTIRFPAPPTSTAISAQATLGLGQCWHSLLTGIERFPFFLKNRRTHLQTLLSLLPFSLLLSSQPGLLPVHTGHRWGAKGCTSLNARCNPPDPALGLRGNGSPQARTASRHRLQTHWSRLRPHNPNSQSMPSRNLQCL